MKLSAALDRANNNFELYRLAAALMVIWGHAYALVPNPQGEDLIARVTGYTYSGSVAVKLFFFLSGLLVANSLLNGASFTSFAVSRFARIWPGLVVSLAVVTWVIGPLVSSLTAFRYLANPETLSKFLHNLLSGPLENSFQQDLPGVFNEFVHWESQGTLWTVPFELMCYATLAALWFLIPVARKKYFSLVVTLMLFLSAIFPVLGVLPEGEIALSICFFALGVTAVHLKDNIVLDFRTVIALATLAFVLRDSLVREVMFDMAFVTAAMWISTRPFARNIRLAGDYSYGVYLYGWPIQQLLVFLHFSTSTLVNQIATMSISVLMGAISWHLVEKPAMSLFKKVSRNRISGSKLALPGVLQRLRRSQR
jgi:peptidoglycan/LPS O-acetylase OafA/YrhL